MIYREHNKVCIYALSIKVSTSVLKSKNLSTCKLNLERAFIIEWIQKWSQRWTSFQFLMTIHLSPIGKSK